MIIKEYHINQYEAKARRDTGLALDELELLVGRFKPHSIRAGQLRGKVSILVDGSVQIRHHFTNKLLWSQEDL